MPSHDPSTLAQLLDLSRTGQFALTISGTIVFANQAARILLRRGPALIEQNGVVTARRRSEASILSEAIKQAGSGKRRLVIFRSRESHPVLAFSICPAAEGSLLLAICADLRDTSALGAGTLKESLGLTRGEARIALGLADGMTLSDVAARAGISITTARGHLSAIFAKAGVKTQTQLLRVMLRAEQLPES